MYHRALSNEIAWLAGTYVMETAVRGRKWAFMTVEEGYIIAAVATMICHHMGNAKLALELLTLAVSVEERSIKLVGIGPLGTFIPKLLPFISQPMQNILDLKEEYAGANVSIPSGSSGYGPVIQQVLTSPVSNDDVFCEKREQQRCSHHSALGCG